MNVRKMIGLLLVAVALITLLGCAKSDPIETRLERAAQLLYAKKRDRAKVEIDAAIKLDPNRTATYRAVVALYSARNYSAEKVHYAEMVLERARLSKLVPKLTKDEILKLHFDIAEASWLARNLTKAEREYRVALKLGPNNALVLNSFGFFLADEGIKLGEALKMTKRAVSLDPNNGSIIDSLGWTQYKLGDYKSAIKTLKQAVYFVSDSAEMRYHLGAAYAKAGMRAEAKIELNKALVIKPSLSEAATLLKTLK